MPAPYDYSRAMPKMPDPIGSYARGAELGYGIQQRELETQQQQVELANKRAAAQRRVEMQDAIAGLMENKSSGAIRDVMTQFPETIETLKPLFSEYTAQELQQKISAATPVYAALLNNRKDLAADFYEKQATAAENSGDDEGAAIARANARRALEAPDVLRTELGMTLATAMGTNEFASTYKNLEESFRESVKAKVEAAKAQSPNRIALRELGIVGTPSKPTDADKFSNGLTMYRTDVGEVYGVDVNGSVLVGKEYAKAINDARDYEIAAEQAKYSAREEGRWGGQKDIRPIVEGAVAGAKKAAEIGQTQGQKAYETLGKVRLSLGNIDAAIGALDAGANTGAIASRFPNWNAATIELANIQNLLGLDVVGSVTFGALSESELALALATALPMNMNETELRAWLVRKKDANNKLANYLEDQAKFLLSGNTLDKWLEKTNYRETPTGAIAPRRSPSTFTTSTGITFEIFE